MNTELQDIRVDLLRRAGVSESVIKKALDSDSTFTALSVVADRMERAPDKTWFREFYKLSGDHMVLTEEGWAPPDRAEGMEILDEVNPKQ